MKGHKRDNSMEIDDELMEQLAERIHDRWAAGRRAALWAYGPQRDDENKLHPCLVAYDKRPDSEKEYDRATARETIQTLTGLGYAIVKANPPAGSA